jgi:hypothetical protein
MKTEEAKEIIIKSLKEQTTVKAHEINYQSKGKIAFVQIYGIMSKLIKNGSVQQNTETDGKKSYTLVDAEKLELEPVDTPKVKMEKVKAEKPIEKETKEKPKQKIGRDLTTYKFNGIDYNKTRLAHALVAQYVKDKRPGLKGLLEIFPDEIVKPYGMIRKIEEAKEISKDRLRFLVKPDEEIKVRDCVIACSNQWTPDRIEILLGIAKKLGYKIK